MLLGLAIARRPFVYCIQDNSAIAVDFCPEKSKAKSNASVFRGLSKPPDEKILCVAISKNPLQVLRFGYL